MSYAIYVGRNHTADGHAWLAGYGDEPSSHWLEIIPRATHRADATITVGVTPEADLPGVLSEIPQARETARHIRVSYSHYKGVPAPLTNGGLNEHGVAVRDVWSPSRPELVAMTPTDQSGPNYSDLARIVVERARTARDGVELIGDLIARHGYSSYGGNSHLIADAEEAWVVIEFAGGLGLWVAERLGADSIRASRPGYIGVVPIADPDHKDFRYASNLVAAARAHGWYEEGDFDVNAVYGDGKGRWAGVQWIEDEMMRRAARREKIGIADMMWALRPAELTGDTAGYGQVVPLVDLGHDALRVLWHSHIGAVAAPFVPVYLGAAQVPEEFRQHRYLSDGEAHRFLDTRHAQSGDKQALSRVPQAIEATRSASYVYKRLLNLVFLNHAMHLPEVTRTWEAFEARLVEAQPGVAATARTLLDAGEPDLAAQYLTYYCGTELLRALDLAEALVSGLEAHTRTLHGFAPDPVPKSPPQIW